MPILTEQQLPLTQKPSGASTAWTWMQWCLDAPRLCSWWHLQRNRSRSLWVLAALSSSSGCPSANPAIHSRAGTQPPLGADQTVDCWDSCGKGWMHFSPSSWGKGSLQKQATEDVKQMCLSRGRSTDLKHWLVGDCNLGSTKMNVNAANEFTMQLRFPLLFTQGPSELECSVCWKSWALPSFSSLCVFHAHLLTSLSQIYGWV